MIDADSIRRYTGDVTIVIKLIVGCHSFWQTRGYLPSFRVLAGTNIALLGEEKPVCELNDSSVCRVAASVERPGTVPCE